jgi:hypothetical protein
MTVGTVPAPDLALSLRRARDLLGWQINPTTYTPAEFYEKRAAKDHFSGRSRAGPLGARLPESSLSFWKCRQGGASGQDAVVQARGR